MNKPNYSFFYFLKKELDKNDGQGKFVISSEDKLIILSDLGNKSNIIDFQEKPYEEKLKFNRRKYI